jgi:hypothetical protein
MMTCVIIWNHHFSGGITSSGKISTYTYVYSHNGCETGSTLLCGCCSLSMFALALIKGDNEGGIYFGMRFVMSF